MKIEREIWEIIKALDKKKLTAIKAHEKICDIIEQSRQQKLVECRNCGDIVEMVSSGEFCPHCFAKNL